MCKLNKNFVKWRASPKENVLKIVVKYMQKSNEGNGLKWFDLKDRAITYKIADCTCLLLETKNIRSRLFPAFMAGVH